MTKTLMEIINERKELFNFHKQKVAEMKKVVEECKNKGDLVFEFFILFADVENASIALQRKLMKFFIDAHRNLVN